MDSAAWMMAGLRVHAAGWLAPHADDQRGGLQEWIKLWNEAARRFTWTRTADQIIDRICRYCSRISGPAH
jgi:hypothetical protein